jgi:drug/metabolite transporter (DMT)-like permease
MVCVDFIHTFKTILTGSNMSTPRTSRALLVLAFFAIYVIWGTTYLANLFALEGLKPFVLSSLRYLLAGVLLTGWIVFRQLPWPEPGSVKVLAISGIVMLVGGSGLVVYAEQYISSGFAAVVIATEPLWFVLLDRKRWSLYFANRLIVAGLLLGFTGIALFVHFSPEGQASSSDTADKITGTLLVLLSAVLWVMGTLYASKRLKPGSSNLVNTAVQLLSAGAFSGLIALLTGEWQTFSVSQVSAKAWGGLLFLVVLGSLVAYVAYTWLIRVQPPAIVSTHTYVNPIVAILLGWLLASETILLSQGLALVLVLAGVALTQLSKDAHSVKNPKALQVPDS